MEPGEISGLHAEASGLPAPLRAGVTELQLPELRAFTVAAGEQQVGLAVPPRAAQKRQLFHFKRRCSDDET